MPIDENGKVSFNGQVRLSGRYLDENFEEWQSYWVGETNVWGPGGSHLGAYDRTLLATIERIGVAETFFTTADASPSIARNLSYAQLAGRANVLQQIHVDGDLWESIPLSVRTCRVVQCSPSFFFERLMREWSFLEMLDAGLRIGEFFPSDWDGTGECPYLGPIGVNHEHAGSFSMGWSWPSLEKRRRAHLGEPGDDPKAPIPGGAYSRDRLAEFAYDLRFNRRRR